MNVRINLIRGNADDDTLIENVGNGVRTAVRAASVAPVVGLTAVGLGSAGVAWCCFEVVRRLPNGNGHPVNPMSRNGW